MSNLRCKICKSTDVRVYTPGIFGDSRHKCNSCGEISFTTDFVEPTVFDRITSSPEVLAENIVVPIIVEYSGDVLWVSPLLQKDTSKRATFFDSKEESIAATVAKLKEVAK